MRNLRWLAHAIATLLFPVALCADGLNDPTRPLEGRGSAAVARPQQAEVRLQSILVSEARRVVVINGQVMAEGDKAGNVEVIAIAEDQVRVKVRGKATTLRLPETEVRSKTPKNEN